MLINNFVKTYCVYTIRCNKTGKTYVGSTSNLLNRIGNHVSSCKSGRSKCTSKLVLENNDFVTSVVLSDLSKLEAKQAEYIFIVAYSDSCVNKNTPITGDKSEYLKNYQKNYRNKEIDKVVEVYDNNEMH